MTSERETPAPQPDASATPPGRRPRRGPDALLPFGVGDRLDEIAQERFKRTDWIELAAAVLLALATIMAAWSAYQATRWSGVQANAYSAAGAARTEATQAYAVFAAQVQIDTQLFVVWLEQRQMESQQGLSERTGSEFIAERFREEFVPAFEAWLAQVPAGELPPESPMEMEAYRPAARTQADELNARADELAAEAREANQTGDNFVLVAVIMASVLFFAGVGTKFKGRGVRLAMLVLGLALFVVGVAFTFSMPQNVGL